MFKLKHDHENFRTLMLIRNADRATKRGIRKGFFFLGKDLMKTAKDSFREPKSGRLYLVKKNGRRKQHRASAPGETPARLTGELKRTTKFNVQGSSELYFGAEAKHAKYLEKGTTRMKKRPYLTSAVQKNKGNDTRHFAREIKKAHRNEVR